MDFILDSTDFLKQKWHKVDVVLPKTIVNPVKSQVSINIKFLFTTQVALCTTFDFCQIYGEYMNEILYEKRIKECIPNIASTSLQVSDQLAKLLTTKSSHTLISFRIESLSKGKLCIESKQSVVKWLFHFDLTQLSDDLVGKFMQAHLLKPALYEALACKIVINKLMGVIREKERELEELAEITRHITNIKQTHKTKPFNLQEFKNTQINIYNDLINEDEDEIYTQFFEFVKPRYDRLMLATAGESVNDDEVPVSSVKSPSFLGNYYLETPSTLDTFTVELDDEPGIKEEAKEESIVVEDNTQQGEDQGESSKPLTVYKPPTVFKLQVTGDKMAKKKEKKRKLF